MLGYFTLQNIGPVQANRLMGGLLLTDIHGLPMDFRYTEPIVASRIQQVLYGKALNHYLKTQVLLPALLTESVSNDLTYLFINDAMLLNSPVRGVGLVRLQETNLETLNDTRSQTLNSTECLLQINKVGSPLKVSWQSHLDETVLLDKLVALGPELDLLEPFERVQQALAMLAQEITQGAIAA